MKKEVQIEGLKNIGKEMTKKLYSIGITSVDELRELGSKGTFFKLKKAYPEVCLVHLYTIQGAIEDIAYNNLSESTKIDLKKYCDSLK